MRRSALMGLAAVAFVASNAFAQATSFAGTWNQVVDPAQQQAAGGGGGGGGRGGRGGGAGFGPTFSIEQDAKALTIVQTRGETTIKSVYNLDGSESKNTMAGRGGNPGVEVVSVAKWEGANLVITTKQPMGENVVEIKRTLSLAADGTLSIEMSRPGQDGNPMTSKVTYKK
jgi:hypothetical protein